MRVLQEREFQRVGGVKTIKADVRILAATNADLERATQKGTFREDLFYRLNVIPLHLPPLRDRRQDIMLLARYFAEKYARRRNQSSLVFSAAAEEILLRHSWPGNVRELENLIERLTILVNDRVVQPSDLADKLRERDDSSRATMPPGTQRGGASADDLMATAGHIGGAIDEQGINLGELINGIERDLIQKALERSGGVRSKAARLLGLNRTTLLEKMKKMGMKPYARPRKRIGPADMP